MLIEWNGIFTHADLCDVLFLLQVSYTGLADTRRATFPSNVALQQVS
jgi:hypothetical protein